MKCPSSASFEKATEKIIPNSVESSIGVMAPSPRASMAAIGCTNLDSIKTSEKFAPAPRGDKTAAEQSVSHQNPQTRGNLKEHKNVKQTMSLKHADHYKKGCIFYQRKTLHCQTSSREKEANLELRKNPARYMHFMAGGWGKR